MFASIGSVFVVLAVAILRTYCESAINVNLSQSDSYGDATRRGSKGVSLDILLSDMLVVQSAVDPEISPVTQAGTSDSVEEELNYWERLVFSFDMDRDPGGSSRRGRGGEKSRSVSAGSGRGSSSTRGNTPNLAPAGVPPQALPPPNFQGNFGGLDPYTLAQLAAAAAAMSPGGMRPPSHDPYAEFRRMQGMFLPNSAHPGFPANYLQQHQQHGNTLGNPSGVSNFPLPGYYPQMSGQQSHSPPGPMHAQQHMPFPYPPGAFPSQATGAGNLVNPGFGVAGPSGHGGGGQAQVPSLGEEADVDEAALSEDKRRRNTAASGKSA